MQIDRFSSSDQTRFFCPFLPAIAHLKMSTIDGGHLAGTPSPRQSGDTGRIQYYYIGRDLKRADKLAKLISLKSLQGITERNDWEEISPDDHNDWLKQRDDSFSQFIPMGEKGGQVKSLFDDYSNGVKSNRDPWCFNYSSQLLKQKMKGMIDFYEQSLRAPGGADLHDGTKISWSWRLNENFQKRKFVPYSSDRVILSMYRRLCCTNRLTVRVPLSLDRVIPRLEFRVCRVR